MENPRQDEPPAEAAARRLRRQAVACGQLGSPLYAGLLEHAADDLLAGGRERVLGTAPPHGLPVTWKSPAHADGH